MNRWGYDDVNGIVVGAMTTKYEFWKDGNFIARNHFENQEEAVNWFKNRYPVSFESGVEMRIFDQ